MVVAVLANIIPFALVRVASRRAEAVVTKGTVRLVVGLIVFPLTWIIIGGLLTGSLLGTLIIAILLALALPAYQDYTIRYKEIGHSAKHRSGPGTTRAVGGVG